jgi:DNA (cytosine-5)-methyltransferase 1
MKLSIQKTKEDLDLTFNSIKNCNEKNLNKSKIEDQNLSLFNFSEIDKINNKNNDNNKYPLSNYKVLKSPIKTKYNVIELFAGAGGTSLGFENAGLNHVLLNEIDKSAVETLRNNFPKNTNIIHDDVAKIDFEQYRGADVVQAGFPCQAFSYAGKSLGFEDTRGTLFFEFARCVKEVKPKIAIGENVRGLLRHDDGKTLKTMIGVLEEIGYNVEYKVLKAQYLDVPQKRERLIILAVRKDLKIPFIFPREQNYIITVGEALKNCPESIGQKYPKRKSEILDLVPEGGYWRNLPYEIQKEYMMASFYHGGGKTGIARRLARSEPSLTLTCSPSQKQTERCHPTETRPLNVREYARIQTFPDDWQFCGSMTSQYKQIGNAVPVNLAYHIGKCVIEMLNKI